MISILDYGVGNLGSISNMFKRLNVPVQLISAPVEVMQAKKLLLPGVGAFDAAMQALADRGLIAPLIESASHRRIPMLGICLGMQLLGRGSEEGRMKGLGLVDAYCRRFSFSDTRLKIPHMGWNQVRPIRPGPLLQGFESPPRFYFVHSYHMECMDPSDIVGETIHGHPFTSMVQRGNIHGAQFHPEKSHRFGMALLRNFAGL